MMTTEERKQARERIKAQLSEYLDLRDERAQIRQQIAELEGTRTAPGTSNWSGMPRGGGTGDPMTGGLIQKDKLIELYRRKDAELTAAQERIESMIEGLTSKERKLMRSRYIEGLKWEAVCIAISYSWEQTHRIHARALDKLIDAETGA